MSGTATELSDLFTVKQTYSNFSEPFRMKIFLLWYEMGKPTAEKFMDAIGEDELHDTISGNTATFRTLTNWFWHDFPKYSTPMDQRLATKIEEVALTTRAEAIDRWAEQGRTLQTMGMKYLDEKGITNSRAALSAVVEGWKMEQTSRSIPLKEFETISRLRDDELIRMLADKLSEFNDGEIIDITPVEDEDVG